MTQIQKVLLTILPKLSMKLRIFRNEWEPSCFDIIQTDQPNVIWVRRWGKMWLNDLQMDWQTERSIYKWLIATIMIISYKKSREGETHQFWLYSSSRNFLNQKALYLSGTLLILVSLFRISTEKIDNMTIFTPFLEGSLPLCLLNNWNIFRMLPLHD